MLTGENIRLRAMEPADLEQMYLWENDTALWEVGDTAAPFSRELLSRFIEASSTDIYAARQLRLIIELTAMGEAIGAIDLFDFNPVSRKAAVGILIYGVPHRGKGYGKEALGLLADYGSSRLSLHQLYAYVPAGNRASVALFTSAGFTQSGLLKDWIAGVDGQWKDALMMQFVFDK